MFKRALALTAALAMGAAGTANAWTANNVCGGGLFITCASVEVTWAGNQVFLTATNNGPGNWVAIGFVNLAFNPGAYTVDGPANFSPPPPNDLNNFDPFRAYASTAGNPNSLPPGAQYSFTFTFTGNPDLDALMADAHVALHGISGPGGCSTKMAIRPDGSTYGTDEPDPLCSDNVVPEPATLVLLATGLVGLAGAQLRRRKNQK